MDLFGTARVRAIGRYGGACNGNGMFRVLFKLTDLNERDDEAQFKKATCPGRRASAQAGDEETLFGKKYRSVSVTKDGEPKPLVKGTQLWVDFYHRDEGGDGVSWRAGCNYFGGHVTILEDLLDVKGRRIVSTDMGCRNDLMRQDQFFVRFFRQDPAWSASGDDLILATERVTIELSRKK